MTEHVNKAVAQRKKWAKFGEEEGRKAGPDLSTTTIGENIPLKLKSNTGKVSLPPSFFYIFMYLSCFTCFFFFFFV